MVGTIRSVSEDPAQTNIRTAGWNPDCLSRMKTKLYWLEDEVISDQSQDQKTMDIFTQEDNPIDTGIVNADGIKIFRFPKPREIGFKIRD